MAKLQKFKSVVIDGAPDVADRLVGASVRQQRENDEKLKSLLDCIVFRGKQNISLRGHRNKKVLVQPGATAATAETNGQSREEQLFDKHAGNPGNFIALLEFRAKAGDAAVLRDFHLHSGGTGGHRVNYVSPRIQNELIDCCGEFIREEILADVRKAKFFSLLADEATDSANTEQMPLVLRFVHQFEVKEEFIGFVTCDTGVTGAALAEKIKESVLNCGLDPKKWRGQGYDGTANMSGKVNGCAAVIQRDYPKALYWHCSAHALNLCVMSMSQIALVSSMWTTLHQVAQFFENSPKRQQKFETVIENMPAEDVNTSQKRKLVSLCRTRWVLRHTALEVFADLYLTVVATLEEISENRQSWNADSVSLASSLLRAITDFSFLASFHITANVMSYIQGLSVGLQEKALDVCQAYQRISTTEATLSQVRLDIETKHSTWWKDVTNMAHKVDVQPAMPRRCLRQQGRDNTPAETPEIYFRRAVSTKLLDELLGQFADRFSSLQRRVVRGLCLLPAALLADPDKAKAEVLGFAEEFESDLPEECSLRTLRAELDTWHSGLSKLPISSHPSSVAECAKLADEMFCKGRVNPACAPGNSASDNLHL